MFLILNLQPAFALDIVVQRPPRETHQVFPVVEQISDEVRLVRISPEIAVEQIRGSAALAHLRHLQSQRPEAFRKSTEVLRKRGHEATAEVFVERTLRTAGGMTDEEHPFGLTQSSAEQSAQGEIVFWSYDGPGYAWQGTIYLEVYATGAAATWDGQIDTGSSSHPWVWHEKTWQGTVGRHQDTESTEPPQPGVYLVAQQSISADDRPDRDTQRVGFYNWAVCWRQGVVAGCTTAAIGCMRVKAAWPACFGMWCVGAEIGSGIGCALL
ncbi:MAG TPA: hypothetical protein VE974_27240 [Thermoanaerobaculia bacterium]|nr:hypothetical protein [Thermoanaerobaculia bacterium]